VWDWGRTGREAEKARISGNLAEKKRNDFRRLIARQLSETRASYNAAQKREELAETAETYARSQLDLVSTAYRNGLATETDYDTAHAAYVRATLERSAAGVSTKIAKIHIEYVLGIPYGGGSDE
ncbi:MAG: TolC family protein, partial [Candidatus Latescibacteria bacterium]|nr:TolC family protein [Candidatus Latescibacterota bacterium]